MNHHHELEWRATCEQPAVPASWTRPPPTRTTSRQRVHARTWFVLAVAVVGFIALVV